MHGTVGRSDRTVLGIGFALFSFFVLSSSDALTKLLSAGYSVYQVASLSATIALVVVGPVAIRMEGLASLRPRRASLVILRSAIGGASLVTAYLAFTHMPLADAYALSFVTPLLVAALSVPMLGEHVGWRQWVAVVLGFVAVVAILRPNVGTVGLGQVFILISAFLFALSMLLLRRMAGGELSGTLLFGYLIAIIAIGLPSTVSEWRTPTSHDMVLLFLAGIGAGAGNLLLIHAFRNAAASVVSSFMYTQLIWGTGYGLLLFGDAPDVLTLAGSAVIICCGLYTLWHASGRRRAALA